MINHKYVEAEEIEMQSDAIWYRDESKVYREEDLFPREITTYEKRDYGYLFYDEENKDSFDSNHAIIFKDVVSDLEQVLKDIIEFYTQKGMKPIIYQSICDERYFEEIKEELESYGFESWTEAQRYMILAEENNIAPNPEVEVKKETQWKEDFGPDIFEKAGEPWEINVAKKTIQNENTIFLVAYLGGKPAGMVHCHVSDGVCRGDYLLVAKEQRNKGVGRAIMYSLVEYCKVNHIEDFYLWTEVDTAEKIYYEAGFRYVETKFAGRAVYKN